MGMGGRMAMRTDAALTLAQWFSPAYPVGSFAYSHGLEWAIETGDVVDAATLKDWVRSVIRHGAGRNDALFLAAAFRANDPAPVDLMCRAFAASRERLMESDLQGAAFCDVTARIWDIDLAGLTYPVAVGRAARLCDMPLEMTMQLYLQAFVNTLVSVGMRLIPLGQTEGHRIIQSLAPLCQDMTQECRDGDLGGVSSSCLVSDIAAMKHETQYARVFRT